MNFFTRTVLIAGCLLCSASVFAAGKLSSESLLAQVEIDDLITKKSPKALETEAAIEAEKEKKKEIQIETQVSSEKFILNEKMMLDELKYQIARHFQLTSDFRIFFSNPWEDVILRSPNWQIVMTSFPPQGLRNQFYVGFELWVDGKRVSTIQRSVRCELWVEAYVAIDRIDRGTVLSEDLVSIRPVEALSIYQTPVEIGTHLSDYVVNNGVKAGTPLFRRDLKERPLIEKNSVIDVVAEEGMMKVSLKAKALEDGVKGQLIRIRNLQSYKDIQAEVIGMNKAKVHF